MRLWSLHPEYLDTKGLLALWRESLLAQKVLQGSTKGYRNHPQLHRFRQQKDPLASIAVYLMEVWLEADRRGYHFDAGKIAKHEHVASIPVNTGQLAYEFRHLLAKLRLRDIEAYARLKQEKTLRVHPLFTEIAGGIESWEVVPAGG